MATATRTQYEGRTWGTRPTCKPKEKRQEAAEDALKEIVGLFESGNLPAAIAQTTIQRLADDCPSAAWSLGNQLLALLAGTSDARGYKQWAEVGRHVKKGARAFRILAPCTRK